MDNAKKKKDKGLYIGEWGINKKHYCIEYLRNDSRAICIVWTPSKISQGIRLVVPNILTFFCSDIVFNLNGEKS